MIRKILVEKIIDADGKKFELSIENESLNEIFEILTEIEYYGILKVEKYYNQGNSINLKAIFLPDAPDPKSSIGKVVFERTKKSISEAFDEMQEEINRLNNKIAELEKELADR